MSRFDSKTYENIKEDMLASLHEDYGVDAQEGSFMDIAVSKMAARLEEAYIDIDNIDQNLLIDTMDREHLIESGAEVGLLVDEGTSAVVKGRLNVQCEIGDIFTATDADYSYIAVEYLGSSVVDDETYYEYDFQSVEPGIDAGAFVGNIEPMDALDGFEAGYIESCVIPGTNEEETEDYRARRMEFFFDRECAGNRAYYRNLVDEFDGVEACKIKRRAEGDEYVTLYVLADGYALPGASLLNELKEYLDPADSSGGGYGEAPIGHKVQVLSALSTDITVSATLEYEAGYSYDVLQEAIETALEKYFTNLRATWEDSSQLVVRISGIENALIDIDGVLDASNTRINDSASNLKLGEYTVPNLKNINVG